MARVQLDTDGTQESGSFPIAEAGDYVLEVVKKVDGFTKGNPGKGTPSRQKVDLMIAIMTPDGQKVGTAWETLTFIPKGEAGHGIMLHVNHALGLPHDGQLDFDTDEYLNKVARGRVRKEEFEGKLRNKVDEWYVERSEPVTTPAAKPAPAAQRPAAKRQPASLI